MQHCGVECMYVYIGVKKLGKVSELLERTDGGGHGDSYMLLFCCVCILLHLIIMGTFVLVLTIFIVKKEIRWSKCILIFMERGGRQHEFLKFFCCFPILTDLCTCLHNLCSHRGRLNYGLCIYRSAGDSN